MSEVNTGGNGKDTALQRGETLPVRDALLVVGTRVDGAEAFAERVVATVENGGAMPPGSVRWVRQARAVHQAFFGQVSEHPEYPNTVPRGVIAFPYVRDASGPGPNRLVATDVLGLDELAAQHDVPIVFAQEAEAHSPELLEAALGMLAAGMRTETNPAV